MCRLNKIIPYTQILNLMGHYLSSIKIEPKNSFNNNIITNRFVIRSVAECLFFTDFVQNIWFLSLHKNWMIVWYLPTTF